MTRELRALGDRTGAGTDRSRGAAWTNERQPHIAAAVVEDHPVTRQGIIEVLSRDPAIEVMGAWPSIESLERSSPVAGICLLDLQLPGARGSEAVTRVAALGMAVLVLSASTGSSDITGALGAGALGYLGKDAPSEEILRAVHSVAGGQTYVAPTLAARLLLLDRTMPAFTEREREVLTLVAEGASDKTIAAELELSLHTVHSHLDRIRDKSGRRRRADLTRLALEMGLVDHPRQ